jgi:hypothetical protein
MVLDGVSGGNPDGSMMTGSPLSRRTLLKTAAALGATGLAGCSESSGNPFADNTTAELKMARLTLSNEDDRAHTLEVTITESGDTVFHVESEVGPAEYENGRIDVINGHLVQGTPTEPGAYVIRASVDGRDEDIFRTASVARSGVPCIPVKAEADQDGSVSIWYTTAESYCE